MKTINIKTQEYKIKPFLKWAGGKGQLLKQFQKYLPNDFNNYIEPFIGGGALFFDLFSKGILSYEKEIILIDSNKELINCYKVIQKNVVGLISELRKNKYKNEKEVFYKIRELKPVTDVQRAARIIYLNRTCFNGLYRVNRSGKFNVPFGGYKNPVICDKNNLLAVNYSLRNVKILEDDFSRSIKYADRYDFIYFDPPYQPLNQTSSFTSYTSNNFDEDEQRRLASVFKRLDEMGCKVMLSNSDTALINELYKDYRIERVLARRAINCNGNKRGKINELVILNY